MSMDMGSPVLSRTGSTESRETEEELEKYKPAYELDDEALERAGRSSSKPAAAKVAVAPVAPVA